MTHDRLARDLASARSSLRRVLVDGGSGAGKTTFARSLRDGWEELCGEQVQLVSLDDCYPGWHGLAAGSRAVHETMLRPVSPGYRRWDWVANRPGEWVTLDPDLPLVVEGCGALTQESAPLAGLRLWLALDEPHRRARALGRDGESYAPWWEIWARQERIHWDRNHPWDLADFIIPVQAAEPDEALNPA
ncbi:cobalt ABC transporter [Luteococcus sp. Sow4_B9]|uniref:cobalt ABC transporter n=1 Tax=Luteococcus sp. Sow4_B9 TaxID=3438792 RepID=UPI003F956C0B